VAASERNRFLYVFSPRELAAFSQLAIVLADRDNARSRTVNRLKRGTAEQRLKQYRQNWHRGLRAEVAFARLFKLPASVEAGIMSGEYTKDAENSDIELPAGQRVEIKASSHPPEVAHLLVPADNNPKRIGLGTRRLKADFYMLTHARRDGSIVLTGYVTAAYFRKHYKVRDFGTGPCLALKGGQLAPVQGLWDIVYPSAASLEAGTCNFCASQPPGLVRLEPSGWACLSCYVNKLAQGMEMSDGA
jgi:hypothetical protein